MKQLPYACQSIGPDDVRAVAEALSGAWLTQGPTIERFESAFAAATDAPDCVAVSSGTAALQLAYAALGLGPGDELITSPITFSATANAARLLGAEVVFADVDRSGNITAESIGGKISERTRGVAAVHYGGLPVDLKSISEVAREAGLWLVEDACHALGASYQGSTIGDCAYSAAAVFSTHAIKNITTGEGGVITSRNPEMLNRTRLLRSHGIDKSKASEPWAYDMVALGWNYRLTDLQCALGLSQLANLAEWVARRDELAAIYRRHLSERFGETVTPQKTPSGSRSGRHLMATQIDFAALGVTRRDVVLGLAERGIRTQVHYIPVHTLSYYRERYGDIALPHAEQFYQQQLSLPFFVDMDENDIARVCTELEQQLTARNKQRAYA